MPKVSPEHFKKRRAEILEAAKKVFIRKGFEPTTMQDVVDESGMSRGGVYQYFSSTEEMFIAIREDSFEDFQSELDELLASHENVWEALNTYLNSYNSEVKTENYAFGLVSYEYSVVAWRKESHRQVIFEQAMRTTSMMAKFLEKGVERGDFKPIYPLEAIVLFIFNVTDGLLLQNMIAGENRDSVHIEAQVNGLKLYLEKALQVTS